MLSESCFWGRHQRGFGTLDPSDTQKQDSASLLTLQHCNQNQIWRSGKGIFGSRLANLLRWDLSWRFEGILNLKWLHLCHVPTSWEISQANQSSNKCSLASSQGEDQKTTTSSGCVQCTQPGDQTGGRSSAPTQSHTVIGITEAWWNNSHDKRIMMDGYRLQRQKEEEQGPFSVLRRTWLHDIQQWQIWNSYFMSLYQDQRDCPQKGSYSRYLPSILKPRW